MNRLLTRPLNPIPSADFFEKTPALDRIAKLAAHSWCAPMAVVVRTGQDRQTVIGSHGSTGDTPILFSIDAPICRADGVQLASLRVLDVVDREAPTQILLDELGELASLAAEYCDLAFPDNKEREEEWYRLFAETARDLFLIVDERRVIVSANRASKSLLGYEPAELAGQPLDKVVPTSGLAKGAATLEMVALNKSGGRVPVEVSFSTFERGERMFTAILRDVRDRKKAEQALAKTTEELRRSLVEKETLLQEVHHRVKNNLQIVSSLLKLQADSLTDKNAAAALRESQQRVHSMSMIHERLYAGKQMAEVEFDHYARQLIQQLVYSFTGHKGNVSGKILPPAIRLNIKQAIPCGLILNELLTNALKYAYPEGREGEVTVELDETPEGLIRVAVSDRGQGLPPGFDWNKSNSVGLRIVGVLTNQLGGTLRMEAGQRTSFILEFPREIVTPTTNRVQ